MDIDPQAVEVTKLSLLLKVLEGESEQTLNPQLELLPDRVLPDLAHNIRCGNSLIGPDFYEGQQLALLDEEEAYRINIFEWEAAFPEVFAEGGFDGVIGNPPYIRIQAMKEWAPVEVEFYKERFRAASKGNYDIYVVFVEKGLQLLNENGRLGFILPHKFFNAKYGEPVREIVAAGSHLKTIVHFGDQQVFAGATTYTCLLFLDKAGQKEFRFVQAHNLEGWRLGEEQLEGAVDASQAGGSEWNFVVGRGADLFQRLSEMPVKLGTFTERIAQGIRTSANEIYVLDVVQENELNVRAKSAFLDREVELEKGLLLDFLQGREIKAYRISSSGKVVIVPYSVADGRLRLIPEAEIKRAYPLTYAYLTETKHYLEGRERGRMRGSQWYGFVYPKNIDLMTSPKILVPDIADRSAFAFDESGKYALTSGYGITLKSNVDESVFYILGLVNSRVLTFFLKQVSTSLRGGFFRYFAQYIEQLPIRPIDFSDPADAARHDRLVALVQWMLDLHKQLAGASLPHSRELLQRQIDATDRQIDGLVYELYGLTEAEIGVVEGRG